MAVGVHSLYLVTRPINTLQDREAADDAAQADPEPDGEVLVAQLRRHWKEIVAEVKTDHSIQLAAALQSVRGVGASGAALTLYFGGNDFARGKCKEQERYLAKAIAGALHVQALTLTCALGDKPPA